VDAFRCDEEAFVGVRSEALSAHGAVVSVVGDLDLANAGELELHLTRRIAGGHQHLVIDLSAATFLDSVAMGTLLRAIAPLRDDATATVVLAGAAGIVSRSLAVSGVGQAFSQYPTRADAARALAAVDSTIETWRLIGRRRTP
jgi:anti-anti-sigma factor